jgi:ribosomal protein S27E
MKKCRWCNKNFTPKHGNEEYCCNEHRREAHLESKRRYKAKYYKKFKIIIDSKIVGTTKIGPHRNKSVNAEARIIKNEWNRTFSNFPSTQYNKKPFNFSANTTTNSNIQRCVECNSTNLHKDDERAEIVCRSCGLVLSGPPIFGVVYPYKEKSTIFTINNETMAKSMDWQEYYVNDWIDEPIRPKSKNNILLDLICAKCYSYSFTSKENFKCHVCGSTHAFGIGILKPRVDEEDY